MPLTTVTLTVTPTDQKVRLVWAPDDTPTDRWEVHRDGNLVVTLYDVDAVTWTDWDIENNIAYSYVVTGETDAVSSAAKVAVPGPRARGVVDPLAATIRYTTLADVKNHLNIAVTDVTWDTELTRVIIASEVAIDQHLGRSFPDPSAGEIQGIPEAVKQVALSTAIAVYNNTNMPAGSGGSDDWFGEQSDSIGEIMRREVRRNPLLAGLRVGWGVAGGTSR